MLVADNELESLGHFSAAHDPARQLNPEPLNPAGRGVPVLCPMGGQRRATTVNDQSDEQGVTCGKSRSLDWRRPLIDNS
jgi:hypothetical protein